MMGVSPPYKEPGQEFDKEFEPKVDEKVKQLTLQAINALKAATDVYSDWHGKPHSQLLSVLIVAGKTLADLLPADYAETPTGREWRRDAENFWEDYQRKRDKATGASEIDHEGN